MGPETVQERSGVLSRGTVPMKGTEVLSMRGGGGQEKGSKGVGLDQSHIMCCCPGKEAEKELDAESHSPMQYPHR